MLTDRDPRGNSMASLVRVGRGRYCILSSLHEVGEASGSRVSESQVEKLV